MTRYIIGDRGTGKTRALARWVLEGKVLPNPGSTPGVWSRVILVGTVSERNVATREITREILGGSRRRRDKLLAEIPVVGELVRVATPHSLRGMSNDVEVAIDNADLVLLALMSDVFSFHGEPAVVAINSESARVLGDRTSMGPSVHGAGT